MGEYHDWVWPGRETRWGTKKGVVRGKACRIHENLSTPAAGNEIGDPGAKHLSVALAKCPNMHNLDLSGQWVTSCLGAVRWEVGFGRGMCTDGGRKNGKTESAAGRDGEK